MNKNKQPSNAELFSELCTAERHEYAKTGFQLSCRDQLKKLRDKRTTWYGHEELMLRYKIDKFLKGE